MIKQNILKFVNKLGYSISRVDSYTSYNNEVALRREIRDVEFWEIHDLCRPYTMTSIERMYALHNAVKYVLANDIKGDFVECGVWRGGCIMWIAYMLSNRGIKDRKLFLYDTFEGMTKPAETDIDPKGESAQAIFNKLRKVGWCLADLNDVQNNMQATKYPTENIVYVKGKVEETLPAKMPGMISLLRLDTDWYESTLHELTHLYPILSKNGVLIIDDYGHWEGCRKAVDEYFDKDKDSVVLNRIDYCGRIGLKNK